MTSRERVLAAVNFTRPDKIPIDLGGMRASGINAVVYDRLKRRMGIKTPTKIHDTMQILAEVEIDAIDKLGIDVIPLDAGDAEWAGQPASHGNPKELFCGQEVYFSPSSDIRVGGDGSWQLYDSSQKMIARMPKDGYYFDFVNPAAGSFDFDPGSFNPVRTVSDEVLRAMETRGRHLFENTDKALLGWGSSITLIGLSALLGPSITQGDLTQWMILLLTEKDTAHELMGRYVNATIECTKLFHQAVGDYCFAWGVGGDDAGTQRGEFIAPDLFTEMIKPHYKKLCGWVHENTNWKTFLHSCGSIHSYIPDWIDAGVDIINPVQITAANMEPEKLTSKFGGKVVFWGGGCDTQKILPLGTPEEIESHVKRNMSVFGSGGGGYVFCQVHNIQQNVPVENVEIMLGAASEFTVPK
jgi:uroporphyrinogen-III decarboxylase